MINYLRAYLGTLIKNEKGQGMIEYGLIAVFISVVAITLLTPIGTKVKAFFTTVKTAVETATP